MDESGESLPPGRSPHHPSKPPADEPFDLGELSPVEPDPDTSSARDDAWPRSWLGSLTARRPRGMLATGAVATLVVGGLAGGFLMHQHNVSANAARDGSTVSAVAVVENQLVGGRDGIRTATLSVRLRNLGPRQLTVRTSPPGAMPRRDEPLVSATASQAIAPAGGDTMVLVEVPVPCDADLPAITLPVRTVDGTVHHVAVEAPQTRDILESDRTMCQDSSNDYQPVIRADLRGSLQHPVVELLNTTGQPRRVWQYDEGVNPDSPVKITFIPALPQRIGANATLTLKVRVSADRCVTDLGALDRAGQSSWINLTDTDPDTDVAPTTISDYNHSTGVGLSTLVTGALIAACR